jgi:hypothetical protein
VSRDSVESRRVWPVAADAQLADAIRGGDAA